MSKVHKCPRPLIFSLYGNNISEYFNNYFPNVQSDIEFDPRPPDHQSDAHPTEPLRPASSIAVVSILGSGATGPQFDPSSG